MMDWHFLRPWWLLAFLPLFVLLWRLWRQRPVLVSWRAVCDEHLLDRLIEQNPQSQRKAALMILFASAACMILALAGPAVVRLPVPSFQSALPRVLVLDMSDSMLFTDLKPDRLSRARFKLHDILLKKAEGQFGLVVYTGEAFVVSPLTEDANTIDALLQSLTPDIMPLRGHNAAMALDEARKLILNSGYHQGQVLLLSATPPDGAAIREAGKLAAEGIYTSVLPVTAEKNSSPLYEALARAGKGSLLALASSPDEWLAAGGGQLTAHFSPEANNIPVWRDEGPWFILAALILLMPVFWRGWLQRVDS